MNGDEDTAAEENGRSDPDATLASPQRAARSRPPSRAVRVSFVCFLAAVFLLLISVAAFSAGFRDEWMLFSIDEPYDWIAGLCALAALAAIPASIVSGLIAVPRRPVALFWVIPLLAAVFWVVCLLTDCF